MSFDLQDTFPTLEHAPITEAIIDIQAQLGSDVTLPQLARFQDGIEERFKERKERMSLQTRIEFQKDAAPKVVAPDFSPDGYVFRASEEHLTAQARLDGFTLSRLKPYHAGGIFIEQARELWERYLDIARPIKVTRLAVRNVNRIEMDLGSDLQRYVLTGPEISRALPQQMHGFFMRLVIPDPSGAAAIITETFGEPDAAAGTIPLIFDIDAFREVELEPRSPDIWEIIGSLRALKNRLFFRSITTEALEAFR